MQTVTRAHLTETIYTYVGLSRNESADLLEAVLGRVSIELESGQSVKISGFGTFSVRQKGRRVGRNPKTGKEVLIRTGRSRLRPAWTGPRPSANPSRSVR